jgi:hypothetical protein
MGMRIAPSVGQFRVFFHMPADSVYISPVAAMRGKRAIQSSLAAAGQQDFPTGL